MKMTLKWMFCVAVVMAIICSMWAEDGEKSEDARPYVSIDTRNIVNKTGNSKANFSTLVDRLSHELVETGLYRVMSLEDALRVQKQQEEMSVIGDDGGGKTNVTTPGFFVGMTITTYGLTTMGGQNPLTGSVTQSQISKIELIMKVVDARTGETIKSKNIDGFAVGQVTDANSNMPEQTLQAASKKVCEKIVYELVKLTSFSVLDVEDGVASLDVPGTLKIMGNPIRPGLQFVVYKLGKPKKSPRTGKIKRSEKQVAMVGVTSVGEDSCSAQIVSGAIPPIGDDEDTQYEPYIVRINEGTVAPPPPPPPPPPPDPPGVPF